ncbi:MAG: efflux RND transporter periplasmic adaptor subunit [Muribaculaceae bacterium]|nr:efflux RND transporter periplasmic adaptor subunit [Muribaculaceae bacterium]
MRFFGYAIVLAAAFSGFTFISCSKEPNTKEQVFHNVILSEVEATGQTSSRNYSGVVEEGKSVNAAFMTGGKLLSLNAKEGDRVRKGQLLASLDDTDYQIGVNQLQVQFQQMQAEKKRMDEMYARHNVAPNDYEKFEAGFEQLKLQLDMAKNKLGYTKLYSPSDGFVTFKYMQPGELVDAGTPIYKITDDTQLEVSVDLPLQVYLDRNEIKDAYGTVPNVSNPIPLKIVSFTPDADNNQLYHMKLDIPSTYKKELTTGMNISVTIEMNNEVEGESLIPSRSIFDDNGVTYVWIFNENDSTLARRQINVIGQPIGKNSMVSGLSGNEKIVSTGVKQLKEGEKVNVVSNPLKSK